MVHESCKRSPDLNKNEAKKMKDIEALIAKSVENCALNAAEWREILRRFKQEKDALTQETREKLLEVAVKTWWNRIAYNLDHDYRKKTSSFQKTEVLEMKKTEVTSQETEKIKSETLSAQSNVEFLIQMLQSDLNQMTSAKKWDSLSFWNATDKKAKKEIYEQIISVLQNIKSNSPLTSITVKHALNSELSTSEWGNVFNKNREELKKYVLSFFSGDEFVKDLKQKSVKKIRENLWANELKSLFKREIGSDYKVAMTVPDDKKWLLQEYEAAFDSKNEWGTFSDESKNQAKSFLAYDVTSMVASGLGTGAILKWGTTLAMKSARLATVADKINTGWKTTKAVSAIASAWVEWTTFTALHEGIRNQEWFLNQTDITKKIITNSLMFGTFKLANNAPTNFLASLKTKNPTLWTSLEGLYKQWLVAPALYTASMAGYECMTQAEQKSCQAWLKEFILVWVAGSAFHLSGVWSKKVIEWLGTKTKIDTKTGELSLQTGQWNDVVIPLTKAEVEKIVPQKVEKVVPNEFSFSAPEIKNLESHGIILKAWKLELKWFWDLYGHFFWGKTLWDFVSVQIKNIAKNKMKLTVVDKNWVTTVIDITANKWEMEQIIITNSLWKNNTFTRWNWEVKTQDEWVAEVDNDIENPFLKNAWEIKNEPKIVLKEQTLVSSKDVTKMWEFWVWFHGQDMQISGFNMSQHVGKEVNVKNFTAITIQQQTDTKLVIEFIAKGTWEKGTITITKNGNNITGFDLQNFWDTKFNGSFALDLPITHASSIQPPVVVGNQPKTTHTKEQIPVVKKEPEWQKTPEKVSSNWNLVDFFQWAKVNENNQFKLILMQWAKGNIRIDFWFKWEIKWGFVMMNGESTIFTVSKGNFALKPDNGKITQDDIINLVKQYKTSFTQ